MEEPTGGTDVDEYVAEFVRESEEDVTALNGALLDLAADPDDEAAMDSIFRTVHTLKGNFGAMGLSDAADLAHAIEDLLEEIRAGRVAATPEIVNLVVAGVDEIERALRQVESDGESSIDPARTIAAIRTAIEESARDGPGADDLLASAHERADADGFGGRAAEGIDASLQDTAMDVRPIPLKKVFGKFPRLVRDLARSQGKEVEFVLKGEDVELDRTIANEIGDPLMHLLRNAVDHGIEPPEEREAAGKPREGTIHLRCRRERDRATIEVEDDGRGLDVEAIRETAVEKGIGRRDTVEAMDDPEVYDLVFHPGFSTREEVTDVSGRGVGMDVVDDAVTRLDGTVSLDSEAGEGTTVTLRLPVTVTIVEVLFVGVGDEEYAIPFENVDGIAPANEVETVEGEEVLVHDGTVYPLIRLAETLDLPGATANGVVVRIDGARRQVAIHCDSVNRQEEVAVEPFESVPSGVPHNGGAAVPGEGDAVAILDVEAL